MLGHHLGDVGHPYGDIPHDRLLAQRTSRHDGLRPRQFQFSRHGRADPHLLAVVDHRIGQAAAATKRLAPVVLRIGQPARHADQFAGRLVNAAASPQFTRIVIGERLAAAVDGQPSRTHQPQDVFGMMQHFDALQVVILPENLQADRARGHQRRDAVLDEECLVALHQPTGRLNLARQLERPSAAGTAVAIGPPHLLAGRLEDPFHGFQRGGRQQGHAAGKVTDPSLSRRTVYALQVVESCQGGRILPLLPAVEPECIEFDAHRTARLAQAAHQAVVHHFVGQLAVASVAQEVDRLHIADIQIALQLAGIDADAATGAGLYLEIVETLGLRLAVDTVTAQEDQRHLGEDVHVPREGHRYEKDAQRKRIEPPCRLRRHGKHLRTHPCLKEAAQRSGQEAAVMLAGRGQALRQQTQREDAPERRQGHPVDQHMLRRALHAQGPGAHPLEPGQRDARQHHEQQQVHHEGKGIPAPRMVRGIEITEEDVGMQGRAAAQHVGSLNPPHDNQQEPSEGQAHMHVAEQRIDPEDPAVQQRLADHLADRLECRSGEDAAADGTLVPAGQHPQPASPLPDDHHKHEDRPDEERNDKMVVIIHHGFLLPSIIAERLSDFECHRTRIDAAGADQPTLAAEHALLELFVHLAILAATHQRMHPAEIERREVAGRTGSRTTAAGDAAPQLRHLAQDALGRHQIVRVEIDGTRLGNGKTELRHSGYRLR